MSDGYADTDRPAEHPSTRRTVRLGSGSAYTLVAQVVGLGASFIMSILIARALGPDGKGQLSILQQVPSVLLVFLNLGIASANTYFVGTGRQRVDTALGNSLLIAAILGSVAMPLSLLLTNGKASIVTDLPLTGALLAAVSLPLGMAASYVTSINTGLGELKSIARGQITGVILSLLFVVVAYLSGLLTVTVAMAASLLSLVAGLVWNAGVVRRHTERPKVDLTRIAKSARYSFRAYLGNLAGYLNYRADILILGGMAGAASVGIYSVAVTFAELMWYAPNSIASALFAKSMGSSPDESACFTARTSRITMALMIIAASTLSLVMRPLVTLLYSSEFASASGAFVLLLPGALLMGVGKILSGHLVARGHLYPIASLSATALNIVANVMLIPSMGFRGAAVASAFSYTFLGVFMMRQFNRATGVSYADMLIPRRADATALLAATRGYLRRR